MITIDLNFPVGILISQSILEYKRTIRVKSV